MVYEDGRCTRVYEIYEISGYRNSITKSIETPANRILKNDALLSRLSISNPVHHFAPGPAFISLAPGTTTPSRVGVERFYASTATRFVISNPCELYILDS